SILALVYLLMLWVDGFVQGLGDDSTATGRWLKERAGLERKRRERLVLPIGLFLKFAVGVLSVPLILLQWDYRWPDIYDWYSQLFFGFRIGNTQISGCRSARFDHRVRPSLWCRATVPELARRANPQAGGNFWRRAGLDPHRRGLHRHCDRGACCVVLCRLQSFQSSHPGLGGLRRDWFRPAERGQQFRVRSDPLGGAAHQAW